MIWSGLWIYWANDIYRIGWGNFTLFPFFPDAFYRIFSIDHHLGQGMAWHFFFMWFFGLNGLLYFVYLIASGEWRFSKYKGAQRLAYVSVTIMGLLSILTGLAIYKPVQLSFLTKLCGGYEAARAEHFILTLGFCFFFVVHVVQVARAGWHNFQSMFTGEEIDG